MADTNFSAPQVYFQSGEDDPALVERTLSGDLESFSVLVDRYQKAVFNVALRFLQDANDAEDIAQAVFLKAFERLPSFDPKFRFFSWIYKIAVNDSLNFLRQRKPLDRIEEGDAAGDAQNELERADLDRQVREAVDSLSPEHRAVIVLRHFEGLGYPEIAEVLDISEKKVKSRLFTARSVLRERLEKRGVNQA